MEKNKYEIKLEWILKTDFSSFHKTFRTEYSKIAMEIYNFIQDEIHFELLCDEEKMAKYIFYKLENHKNNNVLKVFKEHLESFEIQSIGVD